MEDESVKDGQKISYSHVKREREVEARSCQKNTLPKKEKWERKGHKNQKISETHVTKYLFTKRVRVMWTKIL